MMFFNNKKGSWTWQQIGIAILVVLVVIIVATFFTRGGSKAFGGISEKISGTGDCDKDGVANMFDKCPCDPSEEGSQFDGCPKSVKDTKDTKYGDTSCCPKE